jgi:hypothetical protein
MAHKTGIEVCKQAYETQPHLKLAVSRNDSSIGSWDESKQRYVVVAGRIISNDEWCSLPYELLINGQPAIKAEDWIPVL